MIPYAAPLFGRDLNGKWSISAVTNESSSVIGGAFTGTAGDGFGA